MQRLGFLKRLVRRVVALSTSNLDNLGNDLTNTVTRKVQMPLTPARVTYIRQRLTDRVYNDLKRKAAGWQAGDEILVAMEIQDLYLADSALPSQSGKLVRRDWRHYPWLGLALGLIRAGTYSPNTRGLSLLHFTPGNELDAFLEYLPRANPMFISRGQALLLLYSLLEHDGEVVIPLLCRLVAEVEGAFSEREAGDRLPQIYRTVISRHRKRLLSGDERERLDVLSQVADSIEKWHGKPYTGGGAREHNVRVRLEPYADIGLLAKPDPFRYGYSFTNVGKAWTETLCDVRADDEVADFLAHRFFTTAARAWSLDGIACSEADVIVSRLYLAWKAIRSAGGYAPIEEISLVAGIEALLEHGLVIELATAREAILAYQKENPYKVRFTVNRMGVLAHARFLEAPGGDTNEEAL